MTGPGWLRDWPALPPGPEDGGIVLDAFAGPGGWSTGMRALGLHDVGIEWDDAAAATRRAEGHLTYHGDVLGFPLDAVAGKVWGLVASPPCQAWSTAGKKGGSMTAFRDALAGCFDGPAYVERIRAETVVRRAEHDAWERAWPLRAEELGWWEDSAVAPAGDPDDLFGGTLAAPVAELVADLSPGRRRLSAAGLRARERLMPEPVVEDERGALMAAVPWYVDRLASTPGGVPPRWIVCEQVPPVLPMWEMLGQWLLRRGEGWSVWTGVLNAADYGVPQTRRRAFLIARRDGVRARPPAPTHTERVGQDSLDGGVLLPWVSMAAALGWRGAAGFPRRADRGDDGYRDSDVRPTGTPSFTVTEKVRSWTWTPGDPVGGPGGDAAGWAERGWSEPAPTIVTTRRSADGIVVGRRLPPGEGRNVGGWGYDADDVTGSVAAEADHDADVYADGETPPAGVGVSGRWVWRQPPGSADGSFAWEPAYPGSLDPPDVTPFGDPLTAREAAVLAGPGPEAVLATGYHDRGWDRSHPRSLGEPAPTLAFGHHAAAWQWTGRSRGTATEVGVGADADDLTGRAGDAGTVPGGVPWADRVNDQSGAPYDPFWPEKRPSSTIAGRDLAPHPGANANRFNGRDKSRNDGIRILVSEAAVLQSYPADYGWAGSKTKTFEQVGNSVPPVVGAAVVAAASGLPMPASLDATHATLAARPGWDEVAARVAALPEGLAGVLAPWTNPGTPPCVTDPEDDGEDDGPDDDASTEDEGGFADWDDVLAGIEGPGGAD